MFELIGALQYLSFAAGDKSQLEIPMEIAESINRENFTPEDVYKRQTLYIAGQSTHELGWNRSIYTTLPELSECKARVVR